MNIGTTFYQAKEEIRENWEIIYAMEPFSIFELVYNEDSKTITTSEFSTVWTSSYKHKNIANESRLQLLFKRIFNASRIFDALNPKSFTK